MIKYILAAAAGVVLAAGLIIWTRWRKKRRQFEEISQIKRRNDALNEALRSSHTEPGSPAPEGPMAISWDDKAVNRRGGGSPSLMVELTELSAYSRRKYVFRGEQAVTVGSGGDNSLVLARDGVAERHCEVRMIGKDFCVRSLSTARTVLIRGKKSFLVGTEGVYLNDGDHIQLGTAEIQFRKFKG